MIPSADVEQAINAPPILEFDPFTPENLLEPTRFHEALRAAGPIVSMPQYECYAVGRYTEVKSAFSDWQKFSSAAGTGLGHVQKGGALRLPGPIVEVDPPEHSSVRSSLNRVLSPAVIRKWREAFEAEAERLADHVVAIGMFDGVTELVEPFVLKVFPDALGIDNSARENLLPIGDLTGNALGPPNDLFVASEQAVAPLMPWFNAKFERSAMLPGGFGESIWALGDTGELAPEIIPPLLRTFLRGGTDTVISGISSALWLLARNPDQWELVKADPRLARGAFEEALRLETPAQSLFRTTRGTVEFAGYTLKDDMKVLCSLAAANRDPDKWPHADRYNIRRSTFGHLALGTGIHVCLGQMIARLEGESILAALARRVDRLELAGPAVHRLNNTARRLDRLPLTVVPRADC